MGRGATGRFEPLDYEHGVPIGVVDDTPYRQQRKRLAPGDVRGYYTDALVEAPGPDGERLGEAGVRRLLERAGTLAPAALQVLVVGRRGDRLDHDATRVILEIR